MREQDDALRAKRQTYLVSVPPTERLAPSRVTRSRSGVVSSAAASFVSRSAWRLLESLVVVCLSLPPVAIFALSDVLLSASGGRSTGSSSMYELLARTQAANIRATLATSSSVTSNLIDLRSRRILEGRPRKNLLESVLINRAYSLGAVIDVARSLVRQNAYKLRTQHPINGAILQQVDWRIYSNNERCC